MVFLRMQLDLNETLLLGQHDYSRITLQLTAMTSELEERNAQIVLLKKKEEHFEQAMLEREALLKQVSYFCHAFAVLLWNPYW